MTEVNGTRLKVPFHLPRHAEIWLSGYLKSLFAAEPLGEGGKVWLTIADHFEPLWRGADDAKGRERVSLWARQWPQIAVRHRDSADRPPQYTFFYPEEEYRPELIAPLAEMTAAGIADVEIHIHHDGEGERDFVDRMSRFKEVLRRRHGLLREQNGQVIFGFIHGNWTLDNSRPDGRWCGLNNEIQLLRDLGCYADFTLPSVPNPAQTRIVNTIYWATDDPTRPRSHDRGTSVGVGTKHSGDLLMVPGPLGIRWSDKTPFRPSIDSGEIAGYNRPSKERVRLWFRRAPRIGDNVFLKLFTHGAQDRNSAKLLGGDLDRLFELITAECELRKLQIFFVSAWQLRLAIDAAVLGTRPPILPVLANS